MVRALFENLGGFLPVVGLKQEKQYLHLWFNTGEISKPLGMWQNITIYFIDTSYGFLPVVGYMGAPSIPFNPYKEPHPTTMVEMQKSDIVNVEANVLYEGMTTVKYTY